MKINHGKSDMFLKIASDLETKRIAFFNRTGQHGEDGSIHFRIADYSTLASAKAFHHAQETQAEFQKAKIFSTFEMDSQSYTVVMKVPGIYVKQNGGN